MREYKKYLNETKLFWMIILVATVFFSIYASIFAIKLNSPSDNGILDQKDAELIMAADTTAAYKGINTTYFLEPAFDEPGIVTSLSSIIIFMFAAAMLYHFMYRGKSGVNAFRFFPIKNGAERLYELITGMIIAVVGVFTEFLCIMPRTVSFRRTIIAYSTAEETIPYGLFDDLVPFLLVLIFVLASLVIMHLFGIVFKYIPVGYIMSLVFLRMHVPYMNPHTYFVQAGADFDLQQQTFYIEFAPFILISIIVIGTFVYAKAVGRIKGEKYKICNFPIAGTSLALGMIIFVNTREIGSGSTLGWITFLRYGYLTLPPIYIILDLGLLIALIIYLAVRRKKNVALKVSESSHKGAMWETCKPYVWAIVIISVLAMALYGFETYNTVNYWFHNGSQYPLEAMIDELETSIQPVGVIFALYFIFKFAQFVLKRNSNAAGKYEVFPIKRNSRFIVRIVGDFLSVWVPCTLIMLTRMNLYKALSAIAPVTGDTYTTQLWQGYGADIAKAVLIVAILTFIDYSFNNVFLKIGASVLALVIGSGVSTLLFYGIHIGNNATLQLTQTALTVMNIILAVVILVITFIICRKDKSRSSFAYAAAEYVFVAMCAVTYLLIATAIATGLTVAIILLIVGVGALTAYFIFSRRRVCN